MEFGRNLLLLRRKPHERVDEAAGVDVLCLYDWRRGWEVIGAYAYGRKRIQAKQSLIVSSLAERLEE